LGVKCGVKNCLHNDRSECQAGSIEVKSVSPKKASRREDTCCSSFSARKQ
jgi:hypothetical protein